MILRVKSPEPSGSIAWEPSRNAHSWAPPGPDEPLPAGRGPEIRAGTGDSSTRSGLRPTAPPRCWEPDHPRKSSGRATRKELRQPMDGLVTIKVPPAAPCSGLTVPPGSCGVQTAFLPSAHWRRKGPSARFAAPVLPRTFRGSREGAARCWRRGTGSPDPPASVHCGPGRPIGVSAGRWRQRWVEGRSGRRHLAAVEAEGRTHAVPRQLSSGSRGCRCGRGGPASHEWRPCTEDLTGAGATTQGLFTSDLSTEAALSRAGGSRAAAASGGRTASVEQHCCSC